MSATSSRRWPVISARSIERPNHAGSSAAEQVLRGALVVIGSRPKMGKTTTYNEIATHFALNHRLPMLAFSLEMTDRGIIERMVAQEARVQSEIFYVGARVTIPAKVMQPKFDRKVTGKMGCSLQSVW
ncbi:DnaB-like helicase C-terminal domain-containing protein [Serratia fonticola]|uniref:DnaB-like helicase C-terminal domain-containing protein n=1 Tax=Serratia fonticola TaxID=47917 RepID=UPI0035E3FD27